MDKTILRLAGLRSCPLKKGAGFKMVDTCAAEFSAKTPYFYSSFDEENEAGVHRRSPTDKKKVLVFGSGPIRIGQGIEFDYCSVHCTWALKEPGARPSSSTTTPRRSPPTLTPATVCTFDPLTPEAWTTLLPRKSPGPAWSSSAARRPSS